MMSIDQAQVINHQQAEIKGLQQRNNALSKLADGRAKLLACYRLGTHKGVATALDMIESAKKKLAKLEAKAGIGQ